MMQFFPINWAMKEIATTSQHRTKKQIMFTLLQPALPAKHFPHGIDNIPPARRECRE